MLEVYYFGSMHDNNGFYVRILMSRNDGSQLLVTGYLRYEIIMTRRNDINNTLISGC